MRTPVELMQEMIRNACVNTGAPDSGHEHRNVQTLVDYFGVSGEIFEPNPGRQSLVYRIEGSDPAAPALALVPHLDVVAADPKGWSVDPFAADIVDGFVYGRGALDMLNVTAAMAQAARPYIRGEKTPRGDLIFCAAADEESGGVFGAKALVEDHWDLVRADYLLTEVAYPAMHSHGLRSVPVSVGEKGAYWSLLSTKGSPSHGSAPYGADNALEKIVSALKGVFETPAPVEFGPNWASFVDVLAVDDDIKQWLLDADRVDTAIDILAVSDPPLARYLHAATHLTLSPNVLEAGSKTNIVPESARAEVDIRALPGMDRGYVNTYLRKAMGAARDDVEIEPVMDSDATLSPLTNPLWEAIGDAVEELDGHRRLVPTLMTVATDARFWRARGTVAYGVGLFDDRLTFGEMLSLFHGRDERVSIESVHRTAALYERVLALFNGE